MKRSQIHYVIDKAHAIAQTFRVCLPERRPILRWMTGCSGNGYNWREASGLTARLGYHLILPVISTKRD